MKYPLIVVTAVYFQLVPIVVAFFRRDRLQATHRATLVWLLLLGGMDLAAYGWVQWLHLGNNMIVSYIFMPLQSAAILWALSEWQVVPIARQTTRICIPLLLVWWVICFVYFEDSKSFSVLGSPVYGFIALVAALGALVTRMLYEPTPLLRSDWGWIIGGTAIYFATNSTVTILQAALSAPADWPLLDKAIKLKSGIDIVAMLCIAGGFLWLGPRAPSGASSSLARSP